MRDRYIGSPGAEERGCAARDPVEDAIGECGFVAVSSLIKRSLHAASIAARSDAPVLIEGETGTGKELVARFIHRMSARRKKVLAVHNCAATPDGLLESELFGHKRGAFTGACYERRGLIEEADGGTLFLDEIGDASAAFQARLLRVLQDGRFKRVGENALRRSDFRLLSATNKDLRNRVGDGRFREDLYYRLNVFRIYLPPLRERPEDIAALADHFLGVHAGPGVRLTGEAMEALASYDWPGNVRELENEITRSGAMAGGGHVELSHLSARIPVGPAGPAAVSSRSTLREMAAEVERGAVAEALSRYGGNRTRAARSLGLSRQGLTKKMRRLGLSI